MPPTARSLLAGLAIGAAVAGCAMDAAALEGPDAGQVHAEVGELVVLFHDDDPATQDWVDLVAPDPAVFEAGPRFREADSRTAADTEPAEQRMLFTGVAEGRTLLVRLDTSAGGEAGVIVWDLVVGDPDQDFSDGTAIARSAVTPMTDGGYLVIARDDPPTTDVATTIDADDGFTVTLVASSDGDGTLAVDVFQAQGRGRATIRIDGTDYVVRSP